MTAMGKMDVLAATMKEVAAALDKGTTSSRSLVDEYLERIEKNNKKGLGLRAVIDTPENDRLYTIADALDGERSKGHKRSVLHGVPILIKDIIDTVTSMGMENTGGLNALIGVKARRNAAIVDQLQDAGVIILGKTNLTTLNNFYISGTANGWSPRGGQTLCPYGRHLDPLGSSSGSGSAVAAGFAAASIGAETNGSISCPAHMSALYSLKPTTGLIPAEEVIHISPRQDALGPMGKSAWDCAALLEICASPSEPYISYVTPPRPIADFRLGIATKPFAPDEVYSKPGTPFEFVASDSLKAEARQLWADVQAILQPGTAAFVDLSGLVEILGEGPDGPPGWREDGSWHGGDEMLCLTYEMRESFDSYLSKLEGTDIKSIKDLLRWSDQHPELAYFEPPKTSRAGELNTCVARDPEDYKDLYEAAIERRQKKADHFIKIMDDLQLDALIVPGGIGAMSGASDLAALGGFPLGNVPYGVLHSDERGEPWGFRIVGRRGADAKVLAIMAACEAIVPPRRIPEAVMQGHW